MGRIIVTYPQVQQLMALEKGFADEALLADAAVMLELSLVFPQIVFSYAATGPKCSTAS